MASLSRPFSLLRGLNELTQYLRLERVRFAAAPILLVSSGGGGSGSFNSNHNQNDPLGTPSTDQVGLDTVGRHVQFRLQQQLGFRTVATAAKLSSLSSSFPTVEAVDETLQLAVRLGATTIAAVGSSHSLHLAKALYEAPSSLIQELILIPATFDACLVAASSHALVCDTSEEVILPSSSSSPAVRSSRSPIVMALPDESLFVAGASVVALRRKNEALWAVMALAVDRLLQSTTDENAWTSSSSSSSYAWNHLVCALDLYQAGHSTTNSAVAEFLVAAGGDDRLVHFGVNEFPQQQQLQQPLHPRSSPLAVAISLATASESSLAQYSVTTLMASLLPALVERATWVTGQPTNVHDEVIQTTLSQLSSMPTPTVVTNESLDTILSYIRDNQAYWNCRDVSDDYFRAILRHHSFVD